MLVLKAGFSVNEGGRVRTCVCGGGAWETTGCNDSFMAHPK